MDVSVNYKIAKNREEAFAIAKKQITTEFIQSFKVTASISYDEENCAMEAKGKGFTLSLRFTESACEATLTLSFLFKAFKQPIVKQIDERLTEYL